MLELDNADLSRKGASHGWVEKRVQRSLTNVWLRRTLLVVQMVENLPAIQETWVGSLGWEDPLEKVMATHSIILAWKIPWTAESGGLKSMGSQSRTQLSD